MRRQRDKWCSEPCGCIDWALGCAKHLNGCVNTCKHTTNHQNAPSKVETTRLTWEGAAWTPHKSNSLRGHADRSNACTDVQSIAHNMDTPADEAGTISMHRIEPKPPNPLTMGANGCTDEMDGSRNHPDMLNMCLGMHSTGNDSKMPINAVESVRIAQNKPKPQNSPPGDAKCNIDEMDGIGSHTVSCTKHVWYSEHGTYY